MPPAEKPAVTGDPDCATVLDVLTRGELTITGRLVDASNVTVLGTVAADGVEFSCVYKPIRGERPLWDFPDGTLAHREVAARKVSDYAGWYCVPRTVLRHGPLGPGMVQQWIDVPEDAGGDVVDLVPADDVAAGWLPVFRAVDLTGQDVVVVHADRPALAVIAGFDAVVNNADRKGSHLLPVSTDRILGVDHGLCFHTDEKLRTILWGWAGDELPEQVVDGLDRLAVGLGGDLGEDLTAHLTAREMAMLRQRVSRLRRRPVFPRPPQNRTPIPWPPL